MQRIPLAYYKILTPVNTNNWRKDLISQGVSGNFCCGWVVCLSAWIRRRPLRDVGASSIADPARGRAVSERNC